MNALKVFALSGLSSGSIALAHDGAHSLIGDYPFNETIQIARQPAIDETCPQSAADLAGPVTTSFVVDTGIWSFDGEGKVTIKDRGMLWSGPTTTISQITPNLSDCEGNYDWLDSTTIDLHYKCTTDNFASYSVVHTTGKVTPNNILVEVPLNSDGSLPIIPFVSGGHIVACTVVTENTVISRTDHAK